MVNKGNFHVGGPNMCKLGKVPSKQGDQIMNLTLRSIFYWILGAFLYVSEVLNAAPRDQDVDEYLQFISKVNTYSPVEHAGSHGTAGFGLGIGLAGYDAPSNPDVMKEHWRGSSQTISENKTSSSRIIIPRVQVHKGIPASFDIGGGLGQDPLTKATLASVYLQRTLYEAFQMPAIAVRASYSKLMGLSSTEASNGAIDGVASYGFLRFFTIYGSYGIGQTDILVKSGQSYGTSLSLEGDDEEQIHSTVNLRSKSVGLQIQILPPFCTLALESKSVGNGSASYLAKFAVGM
jgi:hypothetical protein